MPTYSSENLRATVRMKWHNDREEENSDSKSKRPKIKKKMKFLH